MAGRFLGEVRRNEAKGPEKKPGGSFRPVILLDLCAGACVIKAAQSVWSQNHPMEHRRGARKKAVPEIYYLFFQSRNEKSPIYHPTSSTLVKWIK
jgi:hypothetical protein